MNNGQRLLVAAALVVRGLVLAIIVLDWGEIQRLNTSILVFYERPDPRYPDFPDPIGISTRYGVVGILLGVVAPLGLWAAAAFVALGAKRRP